MTDAPLDNGYISDYLIHWTGKNGEEQGAQVLNTISTSLRLLLPYNRLHIFDWSHEIHGKMVCFTDVPLRYSNEHCKRYGRFGIAFNKLKLMNIGTQPVFYASHACKDDMNTIFRFLMDQFKEPTLPQDVFRALHRHFYFTQRLSDGRADGHDTFYYEREWRLGEQSLDPNENPNEKYKNKERGYPKHTGKLIKENDKSYFAFNPDDVAFLITPQDFLTKINNPNNFRIEAYENLVNK